MTTTPSSAQPVTIAVDEAEHVCGLLQVPSQAIACYVLAHGAGAGMRHPFMQNIADALAARGIATLRYQFPYMEKGSKRPDSPKLAQATVRAAVAQAARLTPGMVLIAGGKSFGDRMTSQAQAASALPKVLGLAFLGFPLHPAGKPADERARHLTDVQAPMLFLQGTRDDLADSDLIQTLVERLGRRATLNLFADADHSFHVPKRSGRTDSQVIGDLADAIAHWVETGITAGCR